MCVGENAGGVAYSFYREEKFVERGLRIALLTSMDWGGGREEVNHQREKQTRTCAHVDELLDAVVPTGLVLAFFAFRLRTKHFFLKACSGNFVEAWE